MSFISEKWGDRIWGYAPPLSAFKRRRRFVAYFYFAGWDCLSLGFHVSLLAPNIELHVPFGFIRVGWQFL